jgi:3-dehydroquinate synthase
MRIREVRNTRSLAYEVRLVDGILDVVASEIAQAAGGRQLLVVTSPTVHELYTRRIVADLLRSDVRTSCLVIEASERRKSLDLVEDICTFAGREGVDRRSVLVSIGGGVCSDLVTFAASWIRRGIAHFRVPTTLIGLIDAGIGIKGAVNFRGRKSFLGSFHPPEVAFLHPAFLATLPDRHLRAGLSEIVKMALIRSSALFDLLDSECENLDACRFARRDLDSDEILWLAIETMLDELEPNLFESVSYERPVDFGHTFSPIVEAASEYTVLHGEAVAVDMALSSTMALHLDLLSPDEHAEILGLFRRLGLPIASPLLNVDRCMEALEAAAKHRGGAVNLILPCGIGRTCCFNDDCAFEPGFLQRALCATQEAAG